MMTFLFARFDNIIEAGSTPKIALCHFICHNIDGDVT